MDIAHLNIASVPAAVLAGGLATRLRPITESIPKALVEVAGQPFIDHQISLLQRNGIRDVVMCLGYRGEMLRDYLGDGALHGMKIAYSFDGEKLLGTGGALRRAAGSLGEVFWIMYGDSYMDIDYSGILACFSRSPALGLMTVIRNDNRWDRSNVIFEDGLLISYDKTQRSPRMKHIDYGVALLRRAALERIPPGEPFDLAKLYSALVTEGQMVGFEVSQRFYEMGSPEGLEETQRYLLREGQGV